MFASHCVLLEWFTFGPSSGRCDGSEAAENAALLAAASMPNWNDIRCRCVLADWVSSRAEVMMAFAGIGTLTKRRPAQAGRVRVAVADPPVGGSDRQDPVGLVHVVAAGRHLQRHGDGHRRGLVVGDGPDPLAVGDCRPARQGEVHMKVSSARWSVAEDQHGDRHGGHARREPQRVAAAAV